MDSTHHGESRSESSACGSNHRAAKKSRRSPRHIEPHNIVRGFTNSEIFGRPKRCFSKLPKKFVEDYQERFKEVNGVPAALHKLFQLFEEQPFDIKSPAVKELFKIIIEPIMMEPPVTNTCLEVYYSGGLELCVDIIVNTFYNIYENIDEDVNIKEIPEDVMDVVKQILQIIQVVSRTLDIGISHLCKNVRLLHFLFSLLTLREKRMFADATLLLEEMLLSEPRVVYLDMKKIPCLPAVLNRDLMHIQQAHLYHILVSAIAVGDSIMGMDASLEKFDEILMDDAKIQLNKANQEYLLSFPKFLDHLFASTTKSVALTIPGSFAELLLRVVGDSFDLSMLDIDAEMAEEYSDSAIYQAAMYCEKSARADGYLMLSTLLSGKCRKKMQEHVVSYDLIRGLEKSVEKLIWVTTGEDHFPSHEEGPEQAVKIHYFRLLYAVADHHIHRYLLLNREELSEIESIAASLGMRMPDDYHKLDKTKCCERDKGLLVELIEKMKRESRDSYLRFWMTRTLESFLRGARCKFDQVFLLKRGLLEDLFGILLLPETPSSEVIQGHFDLLASLMKDNDVAFEGFSRIVDCADKFSRLCHIVENNLVDSNMFVRCMVLSLRHFRSCGDKFQDLIRSSRVLRLYSPLRKRIEVIFNLVQLLDIKTLSQENVSCLNTSIIILLIADLDGELPVYLKAISTYREDYFTTGKELLTKLSKLLEFWLKHYSYSFKEHDIKSLEEVTGFKFDRWKVLVRDLIDQDASSPSAIVRYLSLHDNLERTRMANLIPTCSRTC